MELNIEFENDRFDQQTNPRIIDEILIRLAIKHNIHAYNQCPKCLTASQIPLPGPSTRTQPMPHPSNCKACKTLLQTELADLEQQRRALQADLAFLEETPTIPMGFTKETATNLIFVKQRRKVLEAQLREPCSFSIPLQPYMIVKEPQYRSLQLDRLDPRYSAHQHQGTQCNFGGEVGSAGWEAANLVLRRGMGVMPHLREQKRMVKAVWFMEKELTRQRERERERERERLRKRKVGGDG
ncbi:MAG: hypothetical protein L6R40_005540 [Gallowayella cf. fulva]|nr:MAG: hypothetical protein L6R40_005540 [Xanthomendoza cf. fulva]